MRCPCSRGLEEATRRGLAAARSVPIPTTAKDKSELDLLGPCRSREEEIASYAGRGSESRPALQVG